MRLGHSSVSSEESGGRAEVLEKAVDGERQVVRKPRLHDAFAEQRAPGVASGRGHVREQDLRARIARACSAAPAAAQHASRRPRPRAPRAAARRRRSRVAPEALADRSPVSRLAASAPPQPKRQQRQRRGAEQACRARARLPSAARRRRRMSVAPARRSLQPGVGIAVHDRRDRARRALARSTPASRGSVAMNSAIVGVRQAPRRGARARCRRRRRARRGREARRVCGRLAARQHGAPAMPARVARCAPPRRALPHGSTTRMPARANCAISARQCASGQSLSARLVACRNTANGVRRGRRRAAADARLEMRRARRARSRAPCRRAAGSDRSDAAAGSMRCVWRYSERRRPAPGCWRDRGRAPGRAQATRSARP